MWKNTVLTDKQKLERKKYIGGSDVGAICGLNQYRTPLDTYFSKISKDIEPDDTLNSFMDWGNELEGTIRDKFKKITGLDVSSNDKTKYHKKHKFLAANVDGLTSDKNILEVKCVGPYSRKNWDEETIPPSYLCQCAHYASIYERKKVYIAVFFGIDMPLKIYEYKRNKKFEKIFTKKIVAFWENHVIPQVPPKPQSIEDVTTLHPYCENETSKVATNYILDMFYELKEAREQKSLLSKKEIELKAKIMHHMEDAAALYDTDGTLLCTWRGKENGKRRFNVY